MPVLQTTASWDEVKILLDWAGPKGRKRMRYFMKQFGWKESKKKK